jgi:hypothetical protein
MIRADCITAILPSPQAAHNHGYLPLQNGGQTGQVAVARWLVTIEPANRAPITRIAFTIFFFMMFSLPGVAR